VGAHRLSDPASRPSTRQESHQRPNYSPGLARPAAATRLSDPCGIVAIDSHPRRPPCLLSPASRACPSLHGPCDRTSPTTFRKASTPPSNAVPACRPAHPTPSPFAMSGTPGVPWTVQTATTCGPPCVGSALPLPLLAKPPSRILAGRRTRPAQARHPDPARPALRALVGAPLHAPPLDRPPSWNGTPVGSGKPEVLQREPAGPSVCVRPMHPWVRAEARGC
jgi:hypothetical protein